MNYTDFAARISTLTAIDQNDQDGVFATILPASIDYAEQRIYRELKLAGTSTRDSTNRLMPSAHVLMLPTQPFITIYAINVITPASATSADGASRSPLTATSWDFIDASYGSASTVGLPQYFALQDPTQIAFGPWPDQSYLVEIIGTQRPSPLSASNPTTILTTLLPDLFLSAAMIFWSGQMRNYGAQSDDPQMGVTWEAQYMKQAASAAAEESVKKLGARN